MFFIGHSHVVALEKAADAIAAPYRSLNLWGFGRPVMYGDGPPRLDEQLERMIKGHALVVPAAGGSAHDMLGLAQHPQPFDVALPEDPDLPSTPGPSPPWLRYKLWRVHSALVRKACAAAGVVFAPAPATVLADGRFLRPELCERPCHANAGYGALVLRDIGAAA